MKVNHEKNKEHIIAKAIRWVSENRAKHNAKCNKWAKLNPAKVNARTARRYASKTKATPAWLDADDKWLITEAYALAKLRAKMLAVFGK
jgi:hypothetical protein